MPKSETNLRQAIQIWVNKRRFVSHINKLQVMAVFPLKFLI